MAKLTPKNQQERRGSGRASRPALSGSRLSAALAAKGASESPSKPREGAEAPNVAQARQKLSQTARRASAATSDSRLRRALQLKAQEVLGPQERDTPLWAKVLSAIDVPRAAVFSGGKELSDLIGGGGEASFDDLGRQIEEHRGFGDIEALRFAEGDEWWERGLKATAALAGDVATDPLTYLTVGVGPAAVKGTSLGARLGTAARVAEKGAARIGAKGAGELATKEAVDAAITQAAKRGSLGLSRAEREAADLGTLSLRLGGKAIPGTQGIAEGLSEVGGAVRGLLPERLASRARKLAGAPDEIPLIERAVGRGADDATRATAVKGISAMKAEKAAGRQFVDEAYRGLLAAYKAVTKAGVKDDDIARLVEAGDVRVKPITDWLANVRKEAVARGADIGDLADYHPHRITPEFRAKLAESDRLKSQVTGKLDSPEAPQLMRKYTAGETFMGVVTNGTIEDLNRIARSTPGIGVDVFEKSSGKVLPAYAESLGRAVGKVRAGARLEELGAATPIPNRPVIGTVPASRTEKALARKLEAAGRISGEESDVLAAQAADLTDEVGRLMGPGRARVAPGFVRVYRGVSEGGVSRAGQEGARGRWFTPDLHIALGYAGNDPSKMSYVDIPQDVFDQVVDLKDLPAGVRRTVALVPGKELVLPQEYMGQVRPIIEDADPMRRAADRLALDDQKVAQVDNAVLAAERPDEAILQTQASIDDQLSRLAEDSPLRDGLVEAKRRIDIVQGWVAQNPSSTPWQRRVVAMEQQAIDLEAKSLAAKGDQAGFEQIAKALRSPQVSTRYVHQVDSGMAALSKDLQAEPWLVDAMTASTKMRDPKAWDGLLKGWDKIMNYVKSWQVATPGFVVRNTYGGMWNNYAAYNVGPVDYANFIRDHIKYRKAAKAGRDWTTEVDPQFAKALEAVSASGSGQTAGEVSFDLLDRRLNPLSTRGPATRFLRNRSEDVEIFMRGALAHKVIRQGGTVDEAIQAIERIHFNYRDISEFDRGIKRVIPYWVFTSRNLPLQLELMATHPQKFLNAVRAKESIEDDTINEGEVTPQYLDDMFGGKVGRTGAGDSIFLTPDLPFVRLGSTAQNAARGPIGVFDEALENVTPLIKAPAEVTFGRKSFTGEPFVEGKQVPLWFGERWLGPAMGLAGMANQTADGGWMIPEKTSYLLEQWIPLLGRARRQFPNEPRYQARVNTSWMSFFGISVRTNTDNAQWGEIARQQKELDGWLKEQEDLGFLKPRRRR